MKGDLSLNKLFPKPVKMGIGKLDVDEKGNAYFMRDLELLAEMQRVRLEKCAADGMLISGFERTLKGTNEYQYQEWWLAWEK